MLYTDGLVEARDRDIGTGMRELVLALAEPARERSRRPLVFLLGLAGALLGGLSASRVVRRRQGR